MVGVGVFTRLAAWCMRLFVGRLALVAFPLGVKIILWYTGLLALFQFFVGLLVPLFYPEIIALNPFVVIFNFIFLGVSAVIIRGILLRKYWAYQLMIIWYVVAILYNFLYFFYSYDFFDVMTEILLIGLIFSFVVNAVVIWYLFSQHDYFKHRGVFLFHRRIRVALLDANDHIFMVVFISFWFVTMLVLLFSGGKLLADTFSISNQVQADFVRIGYYDEMLCYRGDTQYRDVCLMTIGISLADNSYCRDVRSSFYRFACHLGV